MSHSDERVRYASSEWQDSRVLKGVRFEVARISLARRAEITRRMRASLSELEFRGGSEDVIERLAASHLEASIDRVYIECGLLAIEGLEIDGERAGAESLVERGPEGLSREIAEAVRRQCRLTEEERKN